MCEGMGRMLLLLMLLLLLLLLMMSMMTRTAACLKDQNCGETFTMTSI